MPSSSAYPSLERKPGKQNWVDKAGGLPSYIERIAKHLHYEKGHSISSSIAMAVNTAKKWCSTGRNHNGGELKADTKAKACAAVSSWEAKKAKSGARDVAEAVRSGVTMTPDEQAELGSLLAHRHALVEGCALRLADNSTRAKAVPLKNAREILEGRQVTLRAHGSANADPDELRYVKRRLAEESRELEALIEALAPPAPRRPTAVKPQPPQQEQAAPAPAAAPHPNELVKRIGDGDPAVGKLQERLNELGYDAGATDSSFGPKTEVAVKSFQADHSLKTDGEVGHNTRIALRGSSTDEVNRRRTDRAAATKEESAPEQGANADSQGSAEGRDEAASAPKASSRPVTPPTFLAKGAGVGDRSGSTKVKEMQGQLAAVGVDPGEQDGRFGPSTEKAVRRLQRKWGLKPDGIVGTKTSRVIEGQAKKAAAAAEDAPEEVEEAASMMSTPTLDRQMKQAKGRGGKQIKSREFEKQHPRGRGGLFIQKGDSGKEVVALQRELGMKNATGNFDARTEEMLRQYQEAQGLEVDGIAGAQTIGRMRDSDASAGKLTGEDQAWLQKRAGQDRVSPRSVREAREGRGRPSELQEAGVRAGLRGAVPDLREIFRLPDGTFAPKGRGKVLRPGQEVSVPHRDGKGTVRGRVMNGGPKGTSRVKLESGPDAGSAIDVKDAAPDSMKSPGVTWQDSMNKGPLDPKARAGERVTVNGKSGTIIEEDTSLKQGAYWVHMDGTPKHSPAYVKPDEMKPEAKSMKSPAQADGPDEALASRIENDASTEVADALRGGDLSDASEKELDNALGWVFDLQRDGDDEFDKDTLDKLENDLRDALDAHDAGKSPVYDPDSQPGGADDDSKPSMKSPGQDAGGKVLANDVNVGDEVHYKSKGGGEWATEVEGKVISKQKPSGGMDGGVIVEKADGSHVSLHPADEVTVKKGASMESPGEKLPPTELKAKDAPVGSLVSVGDSTYEVTGEKTQLGNRVILGKNVETGKVDALDPQMTVTSDELGPDTGKKMPSMAAPPQDFSPNEGKKQLKDMQPGEEFYVKKYDKPFVVHKNTGATVIGKPKDGGKAQPFHPQMAPTFIGGEAKPEADTPDAPANTADALAASVEDAKKAVSGKGLAYSSSGNLRNFKKMGKEKLDAVVADLQGSDDHKAIDKVNEALAEKGMPLIQKGGAPAETPESLGLPKNAVPKSTDADQVDLANKTGNVEAQVESYVKQLASGDLKPEDVPEERKAAVADKLKMAAADLKMSTDKDKIAFGTKLNNLSKKITGQGGPLEPEKPAAKKKAAKKAPTTWMEAFTPKSQGGNAPDDLGAEKPADDLKAKHPKGSSITTTVHATGGKSEKVTGEVTDHKLGKDGSVKSIAVKTKSHGTIMVTPDKVEGSGDGDDQTFAQKHGLTKLAGMTDSQIKQKLQKAGPNTNTDDAMAELKSRGREWKWEGDKLVWTDGKGGGTHNKKGAAKAAAKPAAKASDGPGKTLEQILTGKDAEKHGFNQVKVSKKDWNDDASGYKATGYGKPGGGTATGEGDTPEAAIKDMKSKAGGAPKKVAGPADGGDVKKPPPPKTAEKSSDKKIASAWAAYDKKKADFDALPADADKKEKAKMASQVRAARFRIKRVGGDPDNRPSAGAADAAAGTVASPTKGDAVKLTKKQAMTVGLNAHTAGVDAETGQAALDGDPEALQKVADAISSKPKTKGQQDALNILNKKGITPADGNGATVHLQGHGKQAAKKAGDFKKGDTIVWNYGHKSEVLKVEDKGSMVHITAKSQDGETTTFKKKKGTMMGTEAAGGPVSTADQLEASLPSAKSPAAKGGKVQSLVDKVPAGGYWGTQANGQAGQAALNDLNDLDDAELAAGLKNISDEDLARVFLTAEDANFHTMNEKVWDELKSRGIDYPQAEKIANDKAGGKKGAFKMTPAPINAPESEEPSGMSNDWDGGDAGPSDTFTTGKKITDANGNEAEIEYVHPHDSGDTDKDTFTMILPDGSSKEVGYKELGDVLGGYKNWPEPGEDAGSGDGAPDFEDLGMEDQLDTASQYVKDELGEDPDKFTDEVGQAWEDWDHDGQEGGLDKLKEMVKSAVEKRKEDDLYAAQEDHDLLASTLEQHPGGEAFEDPSFADEVWISVGGENLDEYEVVTPNGNAIFTDPGAAIDAAQDPSSVKLTDPDTPGYGGPDSVDAQDGDGGNGFSADDPEVAPDGSLVDDPAMKKNSTPVGSMPVGSRFWMDGEIHEITGTTEDSISFKGTSTGSEGEWTNEDDMLFEPPWADLAGSQADMIAKDTDPAGPTAKTKANLTTTADKLPGGWSGAAVNEALDKLADQGIHFDRANESPDTLAAVIKAANISLDSLSSSSDEKTAGT